MFFNYLILYNLLKIICSFVILVHSNIMRSTYRFSQNTIIILKSKVPYKRNTVIECWMNCYGITCNVDNFNNEFNSGCHDKIRPYLTNPYKVHTVYWRITIYTILVLFVLVQNKNVMPIFDPKAKVCILTSKFSTW